MNKKALFGTVAGLAMVAATPASAITWIDWSAAGATATGTAGGVTATVTNSDPVGTYSHVANGQSYYWTGSGLAGAIDAYGAESAALAAIGDIITFSNGGTHTVTLSPNVTTIYLALVSWNDPAPGTTFSAPFTVLSQGVGYFGGGGTLSSGTTICAPAGCAGSGEEVNGIISFAGSSFTFTDSGEAFHGLQIGFDQISPVPEASTWAMMLAGFGMLGAAMRRRKTDQRVRLNFG